MRFEPLRSGLAGRCGVGLVLVTVLFALNVGAVEAPAPIAADWSLDAADGRNLNFHADTAGRPSVLVFWATWCPYCRALFPHLEIVRQQYGEQGVEFFALNIWEDGDPLAYFGEHDYAMTLILAADLVAEDYGVKGTPAVYVVDGQHRVVYQRQRGEKPEDVEQALRLALDAALDVR